MANILMSYVHYPLTVAGFFKRAFTHLGHNVFSVGPYNEGIPWAANRNFTRYIDKPDLIMSQGLVGDYESVLNDGNVLDFKPDVCVQIDAGYWLKYRDNQVAPLQTIHIATDPHCVVGDTLLSTEFGIMRANELEGLNRLALYGPNGYETSTGVVYRGFKETRKIILETGQSLVCTDDHPISTPKGFRNAAELKVGDKVDLVCGQHKFPAGEKRDYAVGFILGAFQGDGSFGRDGFVKFTLGRHEKETVVYKVKEYLLEGFGIDTVTEGLHHESDRAVVLQVRRWGLYRFLKSCNLKSGHIPIEVRRGSKEMVAGYIAGLFATDGCANGGRLSLTTKWNTLAEELQTLLFYIGVPTSNRKHEAGKSSFKPGSPQNTLYVRTGAGTQRFWEFVGKIPGKKYRIKTRRRGVSNDFSQRFRVRKIEGAVKNFPCKRVPEMVYDVVNTQTKTFLANGVVVHNCLNYTNQYTAAHVCVIMQDCYKDKYEEQGRRCQWVPYAFDPKVHYWNPKRRIEHDVTLISGLMYENRVRALARFQSAGLTVRHEVGLLFDRGTEVYNQGRIAFNWSSERDLPMRFWEGLAYRNVVLTNRVPDLDTLTEFQENVHYLAFDTLDECVEKALWVKRHPEEAEKMADLGYARVWIGRHTYNQRAARVLRMVGIHD